MTTSPAPLLSRPDSIVPFHPPAPLPLAGLHTVRVKLWEDAQLLFLTGWAGLAGLGWLLGRGDLVKQTRGSPAQPSPAQPCVPGTTLALWRGGIRSEYEKKHQSNDLASALLCSRLCWLHASLEPQKTTAQQSASFILEADN